MEQDIDETTETPAGEPTDAELDARVLIMLEREEAQRRIARKRGELLT